MFYVFEGLFHAHYGYIYLTTSTVKCLQIIYFCEIPKNLIIQLLLMVLIIRNAENVLLNLWKLCYISLNRK